MKKNITNFTKRREYFLSSISLIGNELHEGKRGDNI
jgi:hypothetical protein